MPNIKVQNAIVRTPLRLGTFLFKHGPKSTEQAVRCDIRRARLLHTRNLAAQLLIVMQVSALECALRRRSQITL